MYAVAAMPELELAAADTMTHAAIDTAVQNNWRLAIAVLDAGGNIVRLTRMDGCNFLSPDMHAARPSAPPRGSFRRLS
jgi:uncharacterized protein GlcG (DUF336 family)